MKTLVILATLTTLALLYVAYRATRGEIVAAHHRALVLRYSTDPTIEIGEHGKRQNFVMRQLARWMDRTAFQDWLSGVLELADVKIRPAQALVWTIAADIVLVALFNAWLGSPIMSQVWAAVFIVGGTWQYINGKQRRRRMTFEKALPDFLMMLASSLRAGLSLQRGIEAVSSEGEGEVERQLRRASTEIAMGVQPDIALAEVAERMKSQDMHWVVVAIGIQRRVGGNLAAILDLVADTIRGRESIRQEVRAVSSEGRMSANVLVALPIGVFLLLVFTRREYVEVLWLQPTGRALLFTTVALIVSGMAWVRSMVSME